MARLLIKNSWRFVRSFRSVLTFALALTVITDLFSLFPELALASEAPSNLVYQGRVIKLIAILLRSHLSLLMSAYTAKMELAFYTKKLTI